MQNFEIIYSVSNKSIVSQILVSKNNRFLLSSDFGSDFNNYNGTTVLWDLKSGLQFKEFNNQIFYAVSENGDSLISYIENTNKLSILRVSSNLEIKTIKLQSTNSPVRIIPRTDWQYIICDNYLWNTDKNILTYLDENSTSFFYGPDSIITVSYKEIKISSCLDPTNSRIISPIEFKESLDFNESIYSIFNPKESRFNERNNCVYFKSQREIYEINIKTKANKIFKTDNLVKQFFIASDGNEIVFVDDLNQLFRIDTKVSQLKSLDLQIPKKSEIGFSSTGKYFTYIEKTIWRADTLHVLNYSTLKQVIKVPIKKDYTFSPVFSSDDEYLFVNDSIAGIDHLNFYMYALDVKMVVKNFNSLFQRANNSYFTKNINYAVKSTYNGAASIWSIGEGRIINSFDHINFVRSNKYSSYIPLTYDQFLGIYPNSRIQSPKFSDDTIFSITKNTKSYSLHVFNKNAIEIDKTTFLLPKNENLYYTSMVSSANFFITKSKDTLHVYKIYANRIVKIYSNYFIDRANNASDDLHFAEINSTGSLLGLHFRGYFYMVDLTRNKILHHFACSTINWILFKETEKLYLLGTEMAPIQSLDLISGQVKAVFSPETQNAQNVTWLNDHLIECHDDYHSYVINSKTGFTIASVKGEAKFSENAEKYLIHDNNYNFILKDYQSHKIICTFLEFNGEWLTISPDGYYMASPNATKMIHFKIGNAVYSFDQFDVFFNRPDIILKRIGLVNPIKIESYEKAYRKRAELLGLKILNNEKLDILNYPSIELAVDSGNLIYTKKDKIKLTAIAKDKKKEIESLLVSVNGNVIHQSSNFLPSNKVEVPVLISLSKGLNIIEITAVNTDGIKSLPQRLQTYYVSEEKQLPDFYIVTIGANEYKESKFNLKYPQKDAEDISRLFSEDKQKYGNIFTYSLLGKEVTPEKIFALKSSLKKSKIDDLVVIFYAGHGIRSFDNDFFLGTYNSDFSNPKASSISYHDLLSLLDGVLSRNRIVFIDACYSGESKTISNLDSITTLNDDEVETIIFRGNDYQNYASIDTTFSLMLDVFQDLRFNNGTNVVVAAAGNQVAVESDKWQNGLFTYCLISGVKSLKADKNKDKKIMLEELVDYIENTVLHLSNGTQRPSAREKNLKYDIELR